MPKDTVKTGGESYFDSYRYTSEPLVKVYDSPGKEGRKIVANLFLGEWVRIIDEAIPSKGPVRVHYRGGDGYIDVEKAGKKRCLEIMFIDVGQGDSILIQTPDDRRILIDGGINEAAHQVIYNKYRLDKPDNYIDFEAIVSSHSDADHSTGLIPVLTDPKIAVRRFFHNGLFPRATLKDGAPGKVQNKKIHGLVDYPKDPEDPPLNTGMETFVKAIRTAERNLPVVLGRMMKIAQWKGRFEKADGFVCKRLDAADGYLPPYDDKAAPFFIKVLWPRATQVGKDLTYPYYSDTGKTLNGNSVVLLLVYGEHRILLSGDLNDKAMGDFLAAYPPIKGESPLKAHVYKAAHHGSQYFTVDFLKAVRPDAAIISSGDDAQDQHGHPRAVLLGTVTKYSDVEKPAVFSTELAACYSPLTAKEMEDFKAYRGQLYERSIQGIVQLRCDGKDLYLATVHGRKAPDKPFANVNWKYDIWPDKG